MPDPRASCRGGFLSAITPDRRFTSFRNEFVCHVQPLRSEWPAGEDAGDEGPLNWVAAGRVAPGA
jgi:hypothetical protein